MSGILFAPLHNTDGKKILGLSAYEEPAERHKQAKMKKLTIDYL